MSKAAVKISADLLSNPLCEQDHAFLESMTALDMSMKKMDTFNQEKVRLVPAVFHTFSFLCTISLFFCLVCFAFLALAIGIRLVSGEMSFFRHTSRK